MSSPRCWRRYPCQSKSSPDVREEMWLYLLAGLAVAGILLRESLLFLVATVLLLVGLVARVWDRSSLVGLSYRRQLGQSRAFFGEEISLAVEITNAKPLPLAWLEVEDSVPGVGVTVVPGALSPSHVPQRRLLGILLSIRWYERVRRHYRIRCNGRGFHVFGPATLRTGDVFGLSIREMIVDSEDVLLVYPRIVSVDNLGLPAADPFGTLAQRQQWLFEDPLRTVGVRDYRPGDSPRRVHWKATARAGELQVKLLEPTSTPRLVVLLNVSTAETNWSWQGYDPEVLEDAITVAASVASWAVEHGYQVGLIGNARAWRSPATLRLPPSRDARQLMHILEALARLVPMATMPIDELVRLERGALPYGCTVVVVTGTVGEPLLRELTGMRRAGHRPVVLQVADPPWPAGAQDGVVVQRVDVPAVAA
jgi:uncharacterized protein (DUF58 family)